MTQAPATPSFGDIVENGWASEENPTRKGYFVRSFKRIGRMNPGLTWEVTDRAGRFWEVQPRVIGDRLTVTPQAAALEAQQARIAELEGGAGINPDTGDVITWRDECRILSESLVAVKRRATEAQKALRELVALVRGECPRLLDEDSGGNAALSIEIDEALSSQGRREGGEDGLPELPGVNAVPLPASPEGPRSAGWFTMDHDPRSGRKFIALYNDGSGAAMFWRHPDGVIDQNGDEGGWPLKGYDRWAYLPDDLEFWCEICPEDPMTLHLPSPDNTNPNGGFDD